MTIEQKINNLVTKMKISSEKQSPSYFNLNWGNYYKTYIATQIKDTMCAQDITGLEVNAPKPKGKVNGITNFLLRSRFYRLKRQSEYLLSLLGVSGWGLVVDENGEETMVVFNPLTNGAYTNEVWGVIDDPTYFPQKLSTKYQIIRYFYQTEVRGKNKKNIPIAEIYNTSGEFMSADGTFNPEEFAKGKKANPMVFKNRTMIPAFIVDNEESQRADIDRISPATYRLINYLSNETKEIWEYNKLMYMSIGTHNGTQQSKTVDKKIKAGGTRVPVDLNTMNSLGGTPFIPFNGGATDVPTQTSLLGMLIEQVNSFCLVMREVVDSGGGKNRAQNVKLDEAALLHLKNKLIIRQKQYNYFFNEIVFINDKKIPTLNVKLIMDDLNLHKMQSTDPTLIPNIQLKAATIKSQATFNAAVVRAKAMEAQKINTTLEGGTGAQPGIPNKSAIPIPTPTSPTSGKKPSPGVIHDGNDTIVLPPSKK